MQSGFNHIIFTFRENSNFPRDFFLLPLFCRDFLGLSRLVGNATLNYLIGLNQPKCQILFHKKARRRTLTESGQNTDIQVGCVKINSYFPLNNALRMTLNLIFYQCTYSQSYMYKVKSNLLIGIFPSTFFSFCKFMQLSAFIKTGNNTL